MKALVSLWILAALAAAGLLATPAQACAAFPPCGPIPAIIDVKTDGGKYVAFGAADELVSKGKVSYHIDIDNDGYWFDPGQDPELTLRVNKQPPWVSTKVEPASYTVPLSDGRYVHPEGDPSQSQFAFDWEAPITITVTKLRDPTVEELARGSPWIRGDGSYRVVVSASSTSSILAPDVFGPNYGVQEGYGPRELRFIPEIAGVRWVLEDGTLKPSDGIVPGQPRGDASTLAPVAAVAALLGVALWRRRPQ